MLIQNEDGDCWFINSVINIQRTKKHSVEENRKLPLAEVYSRTVPGSRIH
jgi:hypothetical protein